MPEFEGDERKGSRGIGLVVEEERTKAPRVSFYEFDRCWLLLCVSLSVRFLFKNLNHVGMATIIYLLFSHRYSYMCKMGRVTHVPKERLIQYHTPVERVISGFF